MRIEELFLGRDFGEVTGKDAQTIEIIGVTADSREVKPGFLFAALPGTNNDGRDFILEAVEAGAIVILADENTDVILKNETRCRLITDKNPRKRYAEIASAFYKIQPKTIAAVTGTNGKSSVAEFTRQIWQRSNKKCASLGTLGLVLQNEYISSHLTTPDPAELHKVLSQLANDNINNLIIEASSHGLDQCRLDGAKISIAAMTNLSRDHLDYHKTVKEYYAAKFRLFSELLDPDGIAVVNADDPMVGKVLDILHRRGIKYFDFGETANDIRLQKVESSPEHQELFLYIFDRKIEIRLPLIGKFQAMNALCALAIALADGIKVEQALEGVENLDGVKGRLEFVSYSETGASIFVDYAHTPHALAVVLKAARSHTNGKLKVVFGCGGNRDQGKRIEMGEIASGLADEVIVTDDNPRYEDAASIRAQIMLGSEGAVEISDRMDAITKAITGLSKGDLLIIAGKGHERDQNVAGKLLPFNDSDAVKRIVNGGR